MLLVTYAGPEPRLGLAQGGFVFDLDATWQAVALKAPPPGLSMNDLIAQWDERAAGVERCWQAVVEGWAPAGLPVAKARLLAPIPRPRRNPFAIAGNYRQHVLNSEEKVGLPLRERKQPIFFNKPTGTVIGPYDTIEYDPAVTQKVDYELELAIVIGRRGRDIPEEQAMDYVFGYTIANDVSARDIQIAKPQIDYLRGKGLDTFFPLGPGLVPRDHLPNYHDCAMRLYVNDDLRQEATPGQMTRDIPQIVAELSRSLTLEPGDIIATGTPSGVALEMPEPRYLQDGDVVRAEIEGIGALVNPVRVRGRE